MSDATSSAKDTVTVMLTPAELAIVQAAVNLWEAVLANCVAQVLPKFTAAGVVPGPSQLKAVADLRKALNLVG